MQQKTPSSLEKLRALAEESVVEADADMLEHADRHDAIERTLDIAVVDQPEHRVLRAAAFARPLLRARELFLREGDAGHLRARDFGEIERQAAPAAADVEHLGAGLDAELRGEMPLLGKLSVVERLLGGFEIGAAVLLVRVEEELVKPAVEIVVMRHIAPRPRPKIELLDAAKQLADPRSGTAHFAVALRSCRRRIARTSPIVPCSTTNVPSIKASPSRSSGSSRTWRSARAVVNRTTTGVPLPSPNMYVLPDAVLTVERSITDKPAQEN